MEKMKVIELLNKMANGEKMPKKIKCDDYIYYYDNKTKTYRREGASFIYISFDLKDLNNEIEAVEDEIDIDSIENINAYKLPENETDFIQMAEVERLFYWKIDELIKAIKQQQREIDKLKED